MDNNQTNPNNNVRYDYGQQPTPNGEYHYVPQQAPQITLNSDSGSTQAYVRPVPQATQVANKDNSDRSKKILGILIGVLAVAFLAALTAAIINAASNKTSGGMQGNSGITEDASGGVTLNIDESPVTDTTIENDAEPLTYAQIASKVRRAVVGITVYANYYGWGSYAYSEGSGIIVSHDGYVVTNSHVIDDDNYSKYNITVSVVNEEGAESETTEYEAVVVGYDTRTDIAVLKIKEPVSDLVVADLGDSNSLILGDEVVAIGNPGGSQFAGSITNGIVSGLNRVIDEDDGASDSAMRYIQTNAAINPGNSGGPLLNMYGQVIGINTAKIVADGYEGLGFAIPMDTAKPIIEQLIEKGAVERPTLGISCSAVSSQTAQWYDVPMGLLIKNIGSDSPLNGTEAAVGDIITACDGTEITTLSELQEIIERKNVGDTVTLTLFRRGQANTFDVQVALISDDASTQQTTSDEAQSPYGGYQNGYDDGSGDYGFPFGFPFFQWP